MIRRVRSKLDEYAKKGLDMYESRVKKALAAGGDHRPELDRQWNLFRGSKAGRLVQQGLRRMSDSYCFYCEWDTGSSIDHFKPKTPYPKLAFRWTNLNWGCHTCNSLYKIEQWSPDLLNPGGREETAEYFVLDEVTGRLLPDLSRPPADQRKAQQTVDILGLNRDELAEKRLTYAQDFLCDLRAYVQAPNPHGEELLLRYLRPEAPLRTVIRQCIRGRDPAWRTLIEDWLKLSRAADRRLRSRAWWPV